MNEQTKLTADELKATLDANIRRRTRWSFDRTENGGYAAPDVGKLAAQVYDDIVADFKYDEALVLATREVKFNPKYVERVITAMRKDLGEAKVALNAIAGGLVHDGIVSEAKPKLGSGARFKALKKKLAKKGVEDPAALAASIGRKKFGKKRFQQLAAKGK